MDPLDEIERRKLKQIENEEDIDYLVKTIQQLEERKRKIDQEILSKETERKQLLEQLQTERTSGRKEKIREEADLGKDRVFQHDFLDKKEKELRELAWEHKKSKDKTG